MVTPLQFVWTTGNGGVKAALDEVKVDPGDGCTPIPLEYVLIRGFSAMGWKLPATAAGDMLDAIASAVSSTDRADPLPRFTDLPVTHTERHLTQDEHVLMMKALRDSGEHVSDIEPVTRPNRGRSWS
jgi:hypothetical protein